MKTSTAIYLRSQSLGCCVFMQDCVIHGSANYLFKKVKDHSVLRGCVIHSLLVVYVYKQPQIDTELNDLLPI